MTSTPNPWAAIPAAPPGQLSWLRVDADSRVALYWFRNDEGKPGLLIEIAPSISAFRLKELKITIRDIFIDVIPLGANGTPTLLLRLEELQHQDIFLKLCYDLIERANAVTTGEDTFKAIVSRLKKWQALLSGRGRHLLTLKEIQGLYTELYFTGEMLALNRSHESMLVQGWMGPERTQQDFILDDLAIEIKSIAGNQREKVRISSEDQLDSHLQRLYLRVYFLSLSSEPSNGESLNDIVSRILLMVGDSGNRELLEMKLGSAGYIDIPEYDTPLFRVKAVSNYRVTEGFPRITRSMLPAGVESVTYNLVLADIEKFRTAAIHIEEESNG